MPVAYTSRRNHPENDTLAECAQLAFEAEEFEEMFPIYTATAISNNHEDVIDPKL
jgi:hypothetical protein